VQMPLEKWVKWCGMGGTPLERWIDWCAAGAHVGSWEWTPYMIEAARLRNERASERLAALSPRVREEYRRRVGVALSPHADGPFGVAHDRRQHSHPCTHRNGIGG
jgi:hypothetical protein